MSMQYYKSNTQSNNKIITGPHDKTISIIVAFLVVIGLLSVFSAGAPKCMAAGVNPAMFFIKQLIAVIIGYFLLNFFKNYDYKELYKYAIPFSIFVIIMLLIVDFTSLGVSVYGAKRWINLGPIQPQPSEFTKPALILLLACAFYKEVNLFNVNKIVKYFVPIMIMILLVYMQPNLSMIIILLSIGVIMYLSAGGSFSFVGISTAAAVFIISKVIKSYQMSRINIWLNPESDPFGAGYNIIQSLLAFAAGGFWGAGFGNSKQKLAWLPEGHTDFIFAVIAEEMGFIGCAFLILIFVAFILRGLSIATGCKNVFGKLLAVGITLSIGLQAFINMAVSSSMIPATGVTMPFISYGGSSVVVSLAMVGVLLNISKKRIKKINMYE